MFNYIVKRVSRSLGTDESRGADHWALMNIGGADHWALMNIGGADHWALMNLGGQIIGH